MILSSFRRFYVVFMWFCSSLQEATWDTELTPVLQFRINEHCARLRRGKRPKRIGIVGSMCQEGRGTKPEIRRVHSHHFSTSNMQ